MQESLREKKSNVKNQPTEMEIQKGGHGNWKPEMGNGNYPAVSILILDTEKSIPVSYRIDISVEDGIMMLVATS